MFRWRHLFAMAVVAPGLAAAADQAMLELIMPDARSVMEINLDRVLSSPMGQAMSAQMRGELTSFRPAWQDPTTGLGSLDWSHYAQEVIFASGAPPAPGRSAPTLIIVRGMIDPVWIESLNAFRGAKSSYMGVPILSSGGGSEVAFLDGSIAVIGLSADVKAAVRRRGQNTPPSPVLAQGLARYEGQYDVWAVSAGATNSPVKSFAGPAMKYFDHMDSFTGGLRVNPDLEFSADIVMHDEKDVASLTDGLKWFASVIQTQERTAISLEDLNYKADGKRITLALEIPEQQLKAALQQRALPARPTRNPLPPPDISSGLPEPPSGSVRVQSSPGDMGTVLLPVSKP